MTTTAIILAHYKQREANLKRIVDDLLEGTVKPEKIIIFIDNPEIIFDDDRITVIKSSKSFLPNVRFALGSICETDYCFFIDDDLTVGKRTLEKLVVFAGNYPNMLLGLEGCILGNTETPYTDAKSINRGDHLVKVDIIIRTYFVPTISLPFSLVIRNDNPDLPRKSLDDVFLCLGNLYLNPDNNGCLVVPVDQETNMVELFEGGVGQSYDSEHYLNRNIVCKKLKEIYG